MERRAPPLQPRRGGGHRSVISIYLIYRRGVHRGQRWRPARALHRRDPGWPAG